MHSTQIIFALSAILVTTSALFGARGRGRGAGRAFPMDAENFAIDSFQSVNQGIEWDPTNFLVDKSGRYTSCDNRVSGYEDLDEFTPEGETMGIVYDSTNGDGVDAESVNAYIRTMLGGWIQTGEYDFTIRNADIFGCSVRPGCSGRVVVSCLFSPGRYQGDAPAPIFGNEGQAFTFDQYRLAERITGNVWDKSHTLENLAGHDISCSMLGNPDWTFKTAKEMAEEYELPYRVFGVKGEAINRGSTEDAMEKILEGFKKIQSAYNVGCSVIPDCFDDRGDLGGQMWVVVSCIYHEEP